MRSSVLVSVTLASLLSLPVAPARAQTPARAVDLATPRRAVASFLEAADHERWAEASQALDLREIPTARRAETGERSARALASVLEARRVQAEAVPETLGDGESALDLADVGGADGKVTIRRTHHDGVTRWLFTPTTVRMAPVLAERVDRGPIGNLAPRALVEARLGGMAAWQWITLAVALALALVAGWGLGKLGKRVACALAKDREKRTTVEGVIEAIDRPLVLALFLTVLGLLTTLVRLPADAMPVVGRLYGVAWVLNCAWLFLRLVDFGAGEVADRAAKREGWRARGTRTRVMVLRQVIRIVGIVVLVAAALMQFDAVRQVGVSVLASAGVAGIVVGLAAQRMIGNLLAGIQLSFTQPLRVGDQVVVESEFGTVEEINLSYVVIRIWDQRRLIVPMTKLLESPFQNWTRASSELIGEVKVPVDFGMPVARIREVVTAFVKKHPLFDGKTIAVQVTDAKERTAELRVLVSAQDAGKLFDLRCATREFLLGQLQALDDGRYLPRVRVSPNPGSIAEDAAAAE
ncbi:MAG: mechanosensitive ion channel [Sandaracinus sp.]